MNKPVQQPKDYPERVNFDIQERGGYMDIYSHVLPSTPQKISLDELQQRAVYQRLHQKFGK